MKIEPFEFDSSVKRLKIHNVFRYPAKFHPPVASELVKRFSAPGDTVLDPFCGSGTLLIEAVRAGRHARGGDVDPLAVFISDAKTRAYRIEVLEEARRRVLEVADSMGRSEQEHEELKFADLSEEAFGEELGDLWTPAIPNMAHWFRRYVTVDLARLLSTIDDVSGDDADVASFLRLSFAAVLRNASNADPVPVSGLEVTSHMRRLDEAGRAIDAWSLFRAKSARVMSAIAEFETERDGTEWTSFATAHDARAPHAAPQVQAVITSPPYQSAVDYYRRHQLEMFWLGLTESQADRLTLLPSYVGRANTPQSHPDVKSDWQPRGASEAWLNDIAAVSDRRARDFRAYFSAMTMAFDAIEGALQPGGRAVIVVGRSQWGGVTIPTEGLFKDLVPGTLQLRDHFAYAVSNRTMSYARHNGANINEEHVLVFEKSVTPVVGEAPSES